MIGTYNPMHGIHGRRAETWVTVGVSVGSALVGANEQRTGAAHAKGAADEASSFDADRQARIDQTRGVINATFDSKQRKAQYADYAASMRDYLGGELIRQKRDTARNLKFSLAKAGQTGGSVAADAGARLGDEYARGAIANERTVQGNLGSLESQDANSRNQLLALATNGMDMTSGLQRANSTLATNLGNATSNGIPKGLGDVFNETAGVYKAINERSAQRKGFGYKANRTDLYG